MPLNLDSCITGIFVPGNIGASSGQTPVQPIVPSLTGMSGRGVAEGIGTAVGVAGTGHRYWRINMTDNNSAAHDVASMLEVQFHTGANGYGLDAIVGGSASADTNTSTAAGLADDVLTDPSGWASTNTAFPHWWKYDFGSGNAVNVVGVSIIARGPAADGVGGTVNMMAPKDFAIQWSDDNSSWTTKWSETGKTFTAFQVRFFRESGATSYTGSPHGAHAHWRIRPTEDDGGGISSATEIEMRATPGGSDQCSGGTPISNGDIGSGLVDDNAFDNNNATFFASTVTSDATYVGYSFASPVSVAEITWRGRQDSNANQAPKTLFIQFADSGSGPWTTAWGATGQTGWSLSQTRTFTDPNYI